MVKCEQCMQCENVDNNQYEFRCSILYPEPAIIDGRCNRFDDHAKYGNVVIEQKSEE